MFQEKGDNTHMHTRAFNYKISELAYTLLSQVEVVSVHGDPTQKSTDECLSWWPSV